LQNGRERLAEFRAVYALRWTSSSEEKMGESQEDMRRHWIMDGVYGVQAKDEREKLP
jgi:hypothetical protein